MASWLKAESRVPSGRGCLKDLTHQAQECFFIACLQGWPLDWSWRTWMANSCPQWQTNNFPQQWVTVPDSFVQTTRFTPRTCFVMVVVCLAPSKILGIKSPMSSLVATHHTYNLIKCILCDSTGKRLFWLETHFLHNFSPNAFPLSWFCFPASLCNKSQLWVWLYTKSHESSSQLWIVEPVVGTLKPKSYRSFLP